VLNIGVSPYQLQEFALHSISLKQIAFNLYDMNSDNHICEYDLFSFIKHSDNKLFIESINQDFKDIRKKMSTKIDEQKKINLEEKKN
jgi:hypothetical protein